MGHWLIEKYGFAWQALVVVCRFGAALRSVPSKSIDRGLVAGLFLFAFLSPNFDVHALSFGNPQLESYIGEPLRLRIPISEIANPNSLNIELEIIEPNRRGLQFDVDQNHSTALIHLRSTTSVNEPYVQFSLNAVDGEQRFKKDFTILLSLHPLGKKAEIDHTPISQRSSEGEAYLNKNSPIPSNANSSRANNLGPYEFARAGAIPETFGAVLNGQSLWRVARRINEAMGVTRNQMMWALFRANPEAFSDGSVASLTAGSYLSIPSEAFVRSVSDEGARESLALASRSILIVRDKEIDELELQATPELVGHTLEPFQVTSIDNSSEGQTAVSDEQSQQIIASLTGTVSALSQQLVAQDQKIQLLERQVFELTEFIDKGQDKQAPQLDAESTREALSDKSLDASINTSANYVITDLLSTIEWWQWGVLLLLAVLSGAVLMRQRLVTLGRSLNLFNTNERVAFDDVLSSNTAPRERSQLDDNRNSSDSDVGKDHKKLATDKSDNVTADDILNSIAYPESKDDEPLETEEVWRFAEEDIEDDNVDLSFNERFEQLLAEQDFEFARELLDFARYNEINDERYHCERLHLLEKMKDEDGFYEYYYEIESQIPGFPQNLQTQISKLVVQLAQNSDS